jgi:CRISPR-associated protein Csh1
MIKEIVQFTKSLDEDFKNLGIKLREGLHIVLKLSEENSIIRLDTDNVLYERYTKKLAESEFFEKCKFLSSNAWCIDTNKCFDLPAKAIHSCSPFCVAFKREHLEGGKKFAENQKDNKKQIKERLGDYFAKSLELLATPQEQERYKVFKSFFTEGKFEHLLKNIFSEFSEKTEKLSNDIEALKEQHKNENNKEQKENLKKKINELELEKEKCKPLEDADYIVFYLDEPLEKYKEVHQKYLSDKLFNTAQYNTEPDENGEIYGTSNFFNSYNQSMPFLMHKTATFDITGRISDKEAKFLYEFEQLLARNILPKPLPIFIDEEELQKNVIGFFKTSGFKASYREIIEGLWERHKDDFGNYFLLFYANTKDGLVFKDFDFVTKFEYELRDYQGRYWQIEDIFDINYQFSISNVFSFQEQILQVIFNNNLIVKTKDGNWIYKYFDEIDEKYCKSSKNYLLILKYRQAFYDFIYKSKRQAVSSEIFHDIMRTSILEDIRLDKVKNNNHSEYFNIRKKLNIWFSLYEKFDLNFNPNNKTMASKLKEYREFMEGLAEDKVDASQASLEQFAFAAGQVIYYILQKSKSADTSYQRLEPYLQQVSCEGLKKAIANDFARYKHETYSARFERAAAFVLTYQTDANLKKVLPELLAGVFSNNQLFLKKNNTELNEVATSNN